MYHPVFNRKEITPAHSNEEISSIIHEQLRREKAVSAFHDAPEHKQIPAELFLNSNLVNKQRIYGND